MHLRPFRPPPLLFHSSINAFLLREPTRWTTGFQITARQWWHTRDSHLLFNITEPPILHNTHATDMAFSLLTLCETRSDHAFPSIQLFSWRIRESPPSRTTSEPHLFQNKHNWAWPPSASSPYARLDLTVSLPTPSIVLTQINLNANMHLQIEATNRGPNQEYGSDGTSVTSTRRIPTESDPSSAVHPRWAWSPFVLPPRASHGQKMYRPFMLSPSGTTNSCISRTRTLDKQKQTAKV